MKEEINNFLENLLEEWSYRTERGYPDINDQQDIYILRTILKEQKFNDEFIELLLKDLGKTN